MIKQMTLSEQLDIWYQREPGKTLLRQEQWMLQEMFSSQFGYHLLQVAGPNIVDFVVNSPILHKLRLNPVDSGHFQGLQICGKFEEDILPIAPRSLDVVFLPHVLEFIADPKKLLQITSELLIPTGRVIILGFNPVSIWGLIKWFNDKKECPWDGKFLRCGKIQFWLQQLGLKTVSFNSFFYRPPLTREKALQKTLFLEGVGQLCWPSYGAVYLLVAKKLETATTMIKPSLFRKDHAKVKGNMPEATTRG